MIGCVDFIPEDARSSVPIHENSGIEFVSLYLDITWLKKVGRYYSDFKYI